MARAKKNGKAVTFYMDVDILEALRSYANEKGQTLTVAVERIIKEALKIK